MATICEGVESMGHDLKQLQCARMPSEICTGKPNQPLAWRWSWTAAKIMTSKDFPCLRLLAGHP